MVLGLSSFAYGWSVGVPGHMPPQLLSEEDLLRLTCGFGLGCLQLGDNLPFHALTQQRREALLAERKRRGLRIELGARGLSAAHLALYLQLCSEVGAPLLRFVIDKADYHPPIDTVRDIIRDCLPLLHQERITLAIENHDRFKARELAALMESIGDPQVGICLDCANSLGAGEGLEQVRDILAPYTVNLHLKDFRITRLPHQMGFVVEGAIAGQGMADFPALVEALSRQGRCQSAVLEQWVPPASGAAASAAQEQSWARESIHYLQSLFSPAETPDRI